MASYPTLEAPGRQPHTNSSVCTSNELDNSAPIVRTLVQRLSGKATARTGLRMMPTFPPPPLKFRTAGFPRYGFKAGMSDVAFPRLPTVCHRPSCSLRPPDSPCSVSGTGALANTSVRADPAALPQGPSLQSGLCCPGPSTLTRPHPPQLQAHLDFTDPRLIPDALAVRFRLGDPQLVLSFH